MRPKADIEVLFSADQIQNRVNKLAVEITSSIGQEFLLVSILKGSFVFSADLIRSLHRSGATPQIDFLTLSSYGSATESSGHVEIKKDIDEIVKDKTILLVDDILESGRTLAFGKNLLTDRGALSVELCVFLNKPGKRNVDIEANFVGFTCPDKFVVGYGLDYAHYFRELPYVGSLR